MSNAILIPFLGKNVTFAATPQDVAATTGILSDNSLGPVVFTGILDGDAGQNAQTEYQMENISPMDCGYVNNVDITQQTTYTLSEIMQALAPTGGTGVTASANALDLLARTSRYIKLVATWKNNAGTTVRTETAYVKWIRYNPSYRKGKTVGQMTVETVAVSSSGSYIANPAFS